MRQCKYNKYVSNYLDKQLNPLQESQMEEHLSVCHSCKEELEELIKLKKLCAILPEEELPNGLHQSILNIVKTSNKSTRKKIWIKRTAVSLAVALLIFLMGKGQISKFSGYEEKELGNSSRNIAALATQELYNFDADTNNIEQAEIFNEEERATSTQAAADKKKYTNNKDKKSKVLCCVKYGLLAAITAVILPGIIHIYKRKR